MDREQLRHKKKEVESHLKVLSTPVKNDAPTNWALRWITGLIAGPLFLFSSVYAPYLFVVLALILCIVAYLEWDNFILCLFPEDLEKHQILRVFYVIIGITLPLAAIFTGSFHPVAAMLMVAFFALISFHIILAMFTKQDRLSSAGYNHFANHLVGILWIGMGVSCLILLVKKQPAFAFLGLVIGILSDTCAMFVGRSIGKHKIFVALSPKKTWEGFFGGVFGSVILYFLVVYSFRDKWSAAVNISWQPLAVVCILAGFVGQFGDLAQSYFKRIAMIKDSGVFFPGHGGVLDRVCGHLCIAQFLYFATQFPVIKEQCGN